MNIADLLERRSVSPKRLVEPGPSRAQIDLIIQAACAAPDHRSLRPWRFILIRDNARDALADIFETAAKETRGRLTKEQIDHAREKAHNGACLMAVVACLRSEVRDVPVYEQWVSVGAAIQNMLLAAQALGFGDMLVSGEKVASRAVRQGFDLEANEVLLGVLALGSVSKSPKPRLRPSVEEALSIWPPTPSAEFESARKGKEER